MNEKLNRKWRLQRLLHKNKSGYKADYGVLFEECLEVLGNGVAILSEQQSKAILDTLQSSFPFTTWSRIDWDNVDHKIRFNSATDIMQTLNNFGEENSSVFVLWSDGDFPVIQANLQRILSSIDDVTAVSGDTYIFYPLHYVIEFYHESEITIGVILSL